MEQAQLDWAITQIMMALGLVADLTEWYACGDELV